MQRRAAHALDAVPTCAAELAVGDGGVAAGIHIDVAAAQGGAIPAKAAILDGRRAILQIEAVPRRVQNVAVDDRCRGIAQLHAALAAIRHACLTKEGRCAVNIDVAAPARAAPALRLGARKLDDDILQAAGSWRRVRREKEPRPTGQRGRTAPGEEDAARGAVGDERTGPGVTAEIDAAGAVDLDRALRLQRQHRA